jgi:hypothetical protein
LFEKTKKPHENIMGLAVSHQSESIDLEIHKQVNDRQLTCDEFASRRRLLS